MTKAHAIPAQRPAAVLVAREQQARWPAADAPTTGAPTVAAPAAARMATPVVAGVAAHAAAHAAVSSGAITLLGGRRAFKHWPQSRAEIHGVLVQGLPSTVLVSLLDQLDGLAPDDVAAALGLSSRTLRRFRDQPTRPLPADLASKAWQLAETLAQASVVFGDAAAAQRWLAAPAMGLDGARPIDLLRTLQGGELVTEFLGRLAHGVYN